MARSDVLFANSVTKMRRKLVYSYLTCNGVKGVDMNTLIIGNVGYWTEETLKRAFPEDSIILCGTNCEDKKSGNIKWFKIGLDGRKARYVFETFNFERVIYMSEYLTYHTVAEDELEKVRRLLRLCRNSNISQLIYFTSDVVCTTEDNSKKMILEAGEGLFTYYANQFRVDFKIVRCPFLISPIVKNDYLYQLFHVAYRGKDEIELDAPAEEFNHFIDMRDVANFFYRLQDNWEIGEKVLRLFPMSKCQFKTLGDFLKKISSNMLVVYADNSTIRPKFSKEENTVREKFGWVPMYDPLEILDEYYAEYLTLNEQKPSLRERIKRKLHLKSWTMMVIEIIVGSFFVEYLNKISGNSVQFRMIDYRLLFVVIISTIYGTNVGFIAAVIESISLIAAYYQRGSNWLMLFYDPGNWMPFILLFAVAAVCGYIKQKKDEDIHFVYEENKSVREQNNFITQLYEQVLDYKNQYRKDLIGSRDGFGRIFEVVQRLNNTIPEKIFSESIPVMEDVLENDSIAIYSINDPTARFARLEVCSTNLTSELKKSFQLDGYENIIETVKKGEVWFNKDLAESLPMYASGILSEGELSVLIMVYHAGFGQTNNYYSNLIRILSGLMENFIVKAWDYRKAIEERIFISGTNISHWDYFKEQLEIEKQAASNQLVSFRLFKLDPAGKSIVDMDSLLQSKIRNNDLLGQHPDGFVFVMASQVDESSEQIVLKRFLDLGLKCEIVDPASI